MGKKMQWSRANNSKVSNPIWPKFELIWAFMPILFTCKFYKDPIKGDWEKLETSSFFTTQGHVTPEGLVRYGRNLNLSEILCLSSLPVSLMTTEFVVTEKRWRHNFPIRSQWKCSRANNSIVISLTRPKFELIRDFMPVLISCKFCKDPIKGDWENTGQSFAHYKSMGAFWCHGNHSFDLISPKT